MSHPLLLLNTSNQKWTQLSAATENTQQDGLWCISCEITLSQASLLRYAALHSENSSLHNIETNDTALVWRECDISLNAGGKFWLKPVIGAKAASCEVGS